MTFHGTPWNKGKHWPKEIKDKISASMTGRKRPPFSEEWRQHMGESRLGSHMSEQHKKRISECNKGHIPWNKGKKTGLIPWNKGKGKKHGSKT